MEDLTIANKELAERKAQTETVNSLLKAVLVRLNEERIPFTRSQKLLSDVNIELGGKKIALADVNRRIGEARLPILYNEGKISGVKAKYADSLTQQELKNLGLLEKLRDQQLGINKTRNEGYKLDNVFKGLKIQMDSELKRYNFTEKDPLLLRFLMSADRNLNLSKKFRENPLFGFKNENTINLHGSGTLYKNGKYAGSSW